MPEKPIPAGSLRDNPICELVDDETFARLWELGLLDEIAVRNVAIKKEFKRLRQEGGSSTGAIAELARKHYRTFSAIRQVVYNPSTLDEIVQAGEDGKANQ